jgi:hypothetical protein
MASKATIPGKPSGAKPVAPTGTEETSNPKRSGSEDEIRQLAYRKWEAAGCPAGDGMSYWLDAEQELRSA